MIKKVCVFCGSALGAGDVYLKEAMRLGEALVAGGYELIYGGSNIGLMRVIADTVMKGGGHVTGVMPHVLAGREILHEGITELRLVDSMEERKRVMGQLADGFIAMPGGIGTLDELFEALTWNQLGIVRKPVALLNADGFYDQLSAFLDHVTAQGFVRPEHRDSLLVDDDPYRLLNRMDGFLPAETLPGWVEELKRDTEKRHG
ncbi:MAG: TIGR00730 family Rossman fold protein [Bacteroidetes bacterium HGW-Bacteroidetes-22]|nr:MAG: TIGR00730 family Rossman fold protein [Bacteroidetes bacterium HGW-Bacteroidetes-22]